MKALLTALAMLIAVAAPAHADVTGTARVIDGDTIEVRGHRADATPLVDLRSFSRSNGSFLPERFTTQISLSRTLSKVVKRTPHSGLLHLCRRRVEAFASAGRESTTSVVGQFEIRTKESPAGGGAN